AAYHEMQEWALPPAAQARYHAAARVLEERSFEGAHDLLRGGHWRNFQARYPESNRMHKRMLRASRMLWARADAHSPEWRAARTPLWRPPCHDPYWPGVFCGRYLPPLRRALYRALSAAETRLAPPAAPAGRGD